MQMYPKRNIQRRETIQSIIMIGFPDRTIYRKFLQEVRRIPQKKCRQRSRAILGRSPSFCLPCDVCISAQSDVGDDCLIGAGKLTQASNGDTYGLYIYIYIYIFIYIERERQNSIEHIYIYICCAIHISLSLSLHIYTYLKQQHNVRTCLFVLRVLNTDFAKSRTRAKHVTTNVKRNIQNTYTQYKKKHTNMPAVPVCVRVVKHRSLSVTTLEI